MKTYPALDVVWSLGADDDRLGRLIAEIDDEAPIAVEERVRQARFFFASPEARTRAAVKLIAVDPDLSCEPVEVPDEAWAERSQALLGPVRVGRIVVTPPWARSQAERLVETAEGVLITIHPSMGFGTAHHASTRLCLRLVQDLPLARATAIDVGTGSGVLAIAAARLRAARVLGVDYDADALASARENVDLNDVGAVVTLDRIDLEERGTTAFGVFDLALANLTGALIVRAAASLAALVERDGHLIVSGVTAAEDADVMAALSRCALNLVRREEEDGWVGYLLNKAPATSPAPDRP